MARIWPRCRYGSCAKQTDHLYRHLKHFLRLLTRRVFEWKNGTIYSLPYLSDISNNMCFLNPHIEISMIKSSTCFKRSDGKPLSAYFDKFQAQQSADYIQSTLQKTFIPYPCHVCGMWHLSPKRNHTPSETCSHCIDGRGQLKQLYESMEDASRRAEIQYERYGTKLSVYECPHNNGWHLTKG